MTDLPLIHKIVNKRLELERMKAQYPEVAQTLDEFLELYDKLLKDHIEPQVHYYPINVGYPYTSTWDTPWSLPRVVYKTGTNS